jgi:hypothetical protein
MTGHFWLSSGARKPRHSRVPLRLLFLLFCALVYSTAPRADNNVTLNLTHTHPFNGLGVNMWSKPEHSAELRDALLRDLNVRLVRVSLTPDIDVSDQVGPVTVDTMASLIAQRAPAPWRTALADLGQECQALGVEVHAVFYSTLPPWRNDRPRPSLPARIDRTVHPEHIGDEAAWIVAVLLSARRLGVPVSFVEVANEPDGTWNTRYTPKQYVALVKAVKQRLAENELAEVKIEGPGTSTLSSAGQYIAELVRSGALNQIGAISAHDWDTRSHPPAFGPNAFFDAIRNSGVEALPAHVTEYNEDSKRWELPSPGLFPLRGKDSVEFGVAAAAGALRLVGGGANEIFFWEAEDMSWGKGTSYGLLNLSGERRASADALATIFSNLPTNVLISGVVWNGVVIVGSPFRPGMILLVANPSDEASVISLRIVGQPEFGQISLIRSFPTGEVFRPQLRLDKVGRQRVRLAIPAQTVFFARLE